MRKPAWKQYSKKKNNNIGIAKALSILIQLGLTMFATVIVGMLIGRWIDGRLGLGNKATLLFMFLGLVAAIRNMIIIVRNINR